jgi:hypothetical protein
MDFGHALLGLNLFFEPFFFPAKAFWALFNIFIFLYLSYLRALWMSQPKRKKKFTTPMSSPMGPKSSHFFISDDRSTRDYHEAFTGKKAHCDVFWGTFKIPAVPIPHPPKFGKKDLVYLSSLKPCGCLKPFPCPFFLNP